MAVYGYCRVSTQAQAIDGEPLEVQQRQIEGRAMQEGWTLDEVFVERAVSGSRPFGDRQQGSALLARLQPGDVIVAAKLDRMFRSALDALQTCDRFQRDGISLFLLDLGGDVTANGIASLFMRIAAAFAEFERDRLRERIKDVKADQRKRGLHLGGHRPFGYRVDAERRLVPDPQEQAAIARIHELRRTGLSLRGVTRRVRQDLGVSVICYDRASHTAGAAADGWRHIYDLTPARRPLDRSNRFRALGGKYRGLFWGGAPDVSANPESR